MKKRADSCNKYNFFMTSAVDIVKVGISDVKPLCSAETWESGGSGSEWGFVMNGKKVMVA